MEQTDNTSVISEFGEYINESKFKFQGQKLILTWPMHLDKMCIQEHVIDEIGFTPKFLRSAIETGETGHEHTHTLIDFGKKVNYTKCDKFDMLVSVEDEDEPVVVHPNWKPIKTKQHWDNAVKYLAKEDPDNADLAEVKSNIIQAIWNEPNRAAAILKYAETPAQAQAVIATYAAKPNNAVASQSTPDEWHPWQQMVIDFIKTKPDDRTVHWFFDEEGGKGKSRLARYLISEKLAYMVRSTGGDRDFATIIRGALADGWDQRCFIFDLPRVSEAHAIYGPIEACKDGTVTATKYEGGTFTFNSPHVLIFANFLPDCSKLSADRWRIHRLLSDKTMDKPLFTRELATLHQGGLNITRPPNDTMEKKDNVTVNPADIESAVEKLLKVYIDALKPSLNKVD